MWILLTGAAGFIGFHVTRTLLERGECVLCIDNLNPYYDVRLKEACLSQLRRFPNFPFSMLNVADREAFTARSRTTRCSGTLCRLARPADAGAFSRSRAAWSKVYALHAAEPDCIGKGNARSAANCAVSPQRSAARCVTALRPS